MQLAVFVPWHLVIMMAQVPVSQKVISKCLLRFKS